MASFAPHPHPNQVAQRLSRRVSLSPTVRFARPNRSLSSLITRYPPRHVFFLEPHGSFRANSTLFKHDRSTAALFLSPVA